MNAPKRWKEPGSGASPDLRSVLEYAAERAPTAIYVATLTEAVLSQVAAPTPALAAASAVKASAATTSTKLLSLTLAALLAGAGSATLYIARRTTPASSGAASHGAAPAPLPAEPPMHEGDVFVAGPPSPPKIPAAAPANEAERAGPTRSGSIRAKPGASELELLQAARLARRTSEPRALTLLAEHERRFPNSHLREEREVLLIELLSRTRPRLAARRAADFMLRFPGSPYRQRIVMSLAPP